MGCTQTLDNDRNIATANLEFNDSQIEAKKAVEFTLGEKGAVSRIELSVSCRKLKVKDRIIEGDPFFVAYEAVPVLIGGSSGSGSGLINRNSAASDGSGSYEFVEITRSEIISKTHNPKWIHKITLNYNFDKPQLIKIEVYYCSTSFTTSDTTGFILSEHKLLGHCQFSLGDIFGASHRGWFGSLKNMDNEDKKGYMTIQGEELSSNSDKLLLRLECKKLKNMELFSKSDPFLIISKRRDDGSYATCYKSEVMSNNLSPAYEIRSSTLELANGDLNRELKIEVYDWNISGHHVYIGETICTLAHLLDKVKAQQEGAEATPLILLDGKDDPTVREKLQRRHSDSGGAAHHRGSIFIRTCTITHNPSFLDYIKSGAKLQLMIAVDYTLSNKPPLQQDSLHFVDPNDRFYINDYAQAIISVCEILAPYCGGMKKMICPLFGFGGQMSSTDPVSHCFPLTGGNENYSVQGLSNIVNAYYRSLAHVVLSGPTHFSKVINKAIELTNNELKRRQTYTVLLILTDGCIKDMTATIDAIVKAAALPMSILIVGLGNENFAEMHELDSDEKKLQDRNGNIAERDIVQFTELNKFVEESSRRLLRLSVAQSLLEELPAQFLQYYQSKNILPTSDCFSLSKSSLHLSTATIQTSDADPVSSSDDEDLSMDQLASSRSSRYFNLNESYSSAAYFSKQSNLPPILTATPTPRDKGPSIDVISTLNQVSPVQSPRSPLPPHILTLNDVSFVTSTSSGPQTISSTLAYPEDSPRQRDQQGDGFDRVTV